MIDANASRIQGVDCQVLCHDVFGARTDVMVVDATVPECQFAGDADNQPTASMILRFSPRLNLWTSVA